MKKYLLGLLTLCTVAFAATSCDNDDDDSIRVDPQLEQALLAKYPDATRVTWGRKGSYLVADFQDPRSGARGCSAWFDMSGLWYMTECDIPFEALPEAVKKAFAASEYGNGWRIDDVDQIDREGAETIYVIEVERRDGAMDLEVSLYYTADGVLVKTVEDADENYDYGDYIPAQPVPGVEEYIERNYPGARIVEIDRESNGIEVEIIDADRRCYNLYFDRNGQWLWTERDVRSSEVPASVMAVLRDSQYGGWRIDDIEEVERPSGISYRFELEQGDRDVVLEITAEGVLTVLGRS